MEIIIKSQDILNYPDEKDQLEKINIIIKDSPLLIKDDILNKKVLFLFVNPKSGSQEGKAIFEICKKYGNTFQTNANIMELKNDVKVYLFNICIAESSNIGIDLIKRNLEYFKNNKISYNNFKVLIGGGDGTVLSMIECFHKNGIDISKCIFGHIPLGTGNDLSNALGFGSNYYLFRRNRFE